MNYFLRPKGIICNPSTEKVETGGSQVQSQTELHFKIMSQKANQEKIGKTSDGYWMKI